MWASLQVGVSYRTDPDLVEKVLLEIVLDSTTDVPGLLADPAPRWRSTRDSANRLWALR